MQDVIIHLRCNFNCWLWVIIAWRHQAITWTSVDLPSVRFSENYLRAISPEITPAPVAEISVKITFEISFKSPRGNELWKCICILFFFPQGMIKSQYDPKKAEWSREMRDKRMLGCVNLQDWVFIVTQRDRDNAQSFCSTLQRVGPPMGMQIANPTVWVFSKLAVTKQLLRTFLAGRPPVTPYSHPYHKIFKSD